ncbi:hypothetical protein Hanom_Chr12g01067181 [Helianthus anomalus]
MIFPTLRWSVKLSEANSLTSFIMVSTLVESTSGLKLRRTIERCD